MNCESDVRAHFSQAPSLTQWHSSHQARLPECLHCGSYCCLLATRPRCETSASWADDFSLVEHRQHHRCRCHWRTTIPFGLPPTTPAHRFGRHWDRIEALAQPLLLHELVESIATALSRLAQTRLSLRTYFPLPRTKQN